MKKYGDVISIGLGQKETGGKTYPQLYTTAKLTPHELQEANIPQIPEHFFITLPDGFILRLPTDVQAGRLARYLGMPQG
jgi:hypothetical protein